MTLKEIIDGLQMTIDLCLYNPNTGETITEPRNDMDKTTVDACKGAIELLEQKPKPCDDCISRSAVLAIAGDSCLDLDSYEDTREFCDEINDLPSVTPQPKLATCEEGSKEVDTTKAEIKAEGSEKMTDAQIKMLCDDIIIYLGRAKSGLEIDPYNYPFKGGTGIDAAVEITEHIRLNPGEATECSESLCKIISGLKEIAIYFELADAETALDLAYRFASRLYDDVREMRP